MSLFHTQDVLAELPHARLRALFVKSLLIGEAGGPEQGFTGNTSYESLGCVGMNQAANTLAAVVNIHQPSGYDGNACGEGSVEYVRFYLQTGTGWLDLGLCGVNVFDLVQSALPVSYGVSLPIDEPRKYCTVENVVVVRAILSWQAPPPANTPDHVPVWGNVVDSRVQLPVEPFFLVPIISLIGDGLLTLDPAVAKAIDVTKPLPGGPVEALSAAALTKLYSHAKVPVHRYLFPAAHALLQKPANVALAAGLSGKLALGGANLGALLGALADLSGDTSYEELVCAGYNPASRTLEAVLQVKRDAGFSGPLCSAGSTEFVTFYGFFNGVWNTLAATSVTVHDLQAVAAGPLNYAVLRVSPVTEMPCTQLASIPLRAILSWQIAPSGPDYVPVWGNVLDTHIQPQIGSAGEGGLRLLRINAVSLDGYSDIGGQYLANATGNAEDCSNASNSPVGGTVFVDADISPKASGLFDPVLGTVLPGAFPPIYQALITRPDLTTFQLTNGFWITVQPASGPEIAVSVMAVPAYGPVSGGAVGALYYTYFESDLQASVSRTAAVFPADGLPDGNYTIAMTAYVWDGAQYLPLPTQSQSFCVYNGYLKPGQMGDGAPVLTLDLTSAADCGNIAEGDVVTGQFSVSDAFFGSLAIFLTPVSVDNVPVSLPAVQIVDSTSAVHTTWVYYDGSNTNGVSGTFSFSTAGMPACGYTIQLEAWDRALLGDSCEGHTNDEAVGFCLVAPALI